MNDLNVDPNMETLKAELMPEEKKGLTPEAKAIAQEMIRNAKYLIFTNDRAMKFECPILLKTGKRKGQECGVAWTGNDRLYRCNRHKKEKITLTKEQSKRAYEMARDEFMSCIKK